MGDDQYMNVSIQLASFDARNSHFVLTLSPLLSTALQASAVRRVLSVSSYSLASALALSPGAHSHDLELEHVEQVVLVVFSTALCLIVANSHAVCPPAKACE